MTAKSKNWPAYNKSLKRRGQIDFWISEDAIQSWYAGRTGKSGGQLKYSDLAIECLLTFKLVFKQALRQIQGFLESVFRLMDTNLDIPDYSTISRRGKLVTISDNLKQTEPDGINLIIDSTGLKIYGLVSGVNQNTVSKKEDNGESSIWELMPILWKLSRHLSQPTRLEIQQKL